MSLRATTWALYDAPDDIDAKELRILLIIADNVDDDGTGFALSTPTLAELARMSLRTVKYKLQNLKNRGIIRLGDQRTVNYIPANKRPKVYDLCMHTTPHKQASNLVDDTALASVSDGDNASRGAKFARQELEPTEDLQSNSTESFEQTCESEIENVLEQDASGDDADTALTCNRGATDVQQTCNRRASMFAPKTINPINPINPLESVHARERKNSSTLASRTSVRTAGATCHSLRDVDGWEPSRESQALAVELGVDGAAEVAKWRDHVRAGGHVPADLDAAYRNWLRRGSELGIAAKAGDVVGSPVDMGADCGDNAHTASCSHITRMMTTSTIVKNLIKQGYGRDDIAWSLARAINAGADRATAVTRLAASLEFRSNLGTARQS